ncbi:putative MFS transporter [Kineococcus xinjiangensis]|uniref:Putative MFS transporter n=1 Tax=Kineococcus xinjiangensis TaxID=512762 RepID=A0A2S6ID54_9ACTN|nr:MFS transporter [Kineococcus xinjiangensis]PPK92103.1 putative MFS transporter [Kineococcus xinjiangensis]
MPAAPTLDERLDRLPFTSRHRRLLLGSGVGWALDAMDVGLISFVMAALATQWQLSAGQLGWIGSIGFVGMAIGASLGGLLADRLGRRQVFALTLLVYGLATGAAALSWSVTALLVFRFVIGLGLGAELPVASTLVSEFAPARIRGRVVVILEAFWAVGWMLAALIGYFVVASGPDGWRWAFALGAVPAVYAVVVRRGLPESVRFLQAKGRLEEAEATVRAFEDSVGFRPEDVPVQPATTSPATSPAAPGRSGIFAPAMRRRTAGLWAVWFCINFAYYGAFIWIPTLLVAQGFDLVKSFEYTLLITLAQLPGYAVAAVLVERWGRRPTLATFLLGSAVAAVLFGSAETATGIVATGMLLSFANLGAWGALYAATPEVYPTHVRASGAGAAAGFGRIASILAPLSVPPLLALGGTLLVFAVLGAAFALGALATVLLPEMRGAALPGTAVPAEVPGEVGTGGAVR